MSAFTRHPFRVGASAVAVAAIIGAGAITIPTIAQADPSSDTTTPIKHVVVLFDENESYDHYFGTYPTAANTDGTTFTAAASTPSNTNLVSSGALTSNTNAVAPFRLTPSQAVTCSQSHDYTKEQLAVNGGAMNKFVENTSSSPTCGSSTIFGTNGLSMGYYDGNTVTAEWNYAQNFAMSDNSWDTTFGPSTPGALNLISGNTANATAYTAASGTTAPTPSTALSTSLSGQTAAGSKGTVTADPDPAFDDCADTNHTTSSDVVGLSGKNIGDVLNAKNVTWGWFQGGFAPTTKYAGIGTYAACAQTAVNVAGNLSTSYSPHHEPFQYFQSTANPHHLPPTSDAMIGKTDQANHQYDLSAFTIALQNNNLPAVSFLKAAQNEDAHPGNSDPIDEQHFLTREINAIQQSPEWSSTAIVIAYDDSDGWYDHVAPTILNGATDSAKNDTVCTTAAVAHPAAGGLDDRCGPSQRLPLLVISPYSRQNYIDHTMTEQTSITRFIEENWSTGALGDNSFDTRSASIVGMLDFQHPQQRAVILKADGSVASTPTVHTEPAGGYTSATSVTVDSGATYGLPAVARVAVTTDGQAAGGVVDINVDGKLATSQLLSSSTAIVPLPASLSAAHHTVTATYRGSADVLASTSTPVATKVGKAFPVATLKLNHKTATLGKTKLKATITVTNPGSSIIPTGTVKVTLGGKNITKTAVTSKSKGKVTVTLPTFKKTGTQHLRVRFIVTTKYHAYQSGVVSVKVKK